MYGTVMIGRMRDGFEGFERLKADWEVERGPQVAGWVDSFALRGDDGGTVVLCTRFESKESYVALSDDPEQARWYEERIAPLLDGEPQWIDGSWD
ncbi:MAG: hypothetical protein R2737_01600 [Candidatus Nanopelagicales bacterium]